MKRKSQQLHASFPVSIYLNFLMSFQQATQEKMTSSYCIAQCVIPNHLTKRGKPDMQGLGVIPNSRSFSILYA